MSAVGVVSPGPQRFCLASLLSAVVRGRERETVKPTDQPSAAAQKMMLSGAGREGDGALAPTGPAGPWPNTQAMRPPAAKRVRLQDPDGAAQRAQGAGAEGPQGRKD